MSCTRSYLRCQHHPPCQRRGQSSGATKGQTTNNKQQKGGHEHAKQEKDEVEDEEDERLQNKEQREKKHKLSQLVKPWPLHASSFSSWLCHVSVPPAVGTHRYKRRNVLRLRHGELDKTQCGNIKSAKCFGTCAHHLSRTRLLSFFCGCLHLLQRYEAVRLCTNLRLDALPFRGELSVGIGSSVTCKSVSECVCERV